MDSFSMMYIRFCFHMTLNLCQMYQGQSHRRLSLRPLYILYRKEARLKFPHLPVDQIQYIY